jgi:ankyrin repeat protein
VNECKANVEAGEKNGETPLHIAAGRDNVAAIRRLVNECKANVEVVQFYDREENREETKQVLRELGAKI